MHYICFACLAIYVSTYGGYVARHNEIPYSTQFQYKIKISWKVGRSWIINKHYCLFITNTNWQMIGMLVFSLFSAWWLVEICEITDHYISIHLGSTSNNLILHGSTPASFSQTKKNVQNVLKQKNMQKYFVALLQGYPLKNCIFFYMLH